MNVLLSNKIKTTIMKKILFTTAFALATLFTFAGDDQANQLRKMLNRKIIFPDNMEMTQTVSIEIQLEIMPDGCLALTAYKGNEAVSNYIAGKIEDIKLTYQPDGKNIFVYKFTFEKELKN